MPAPSLDFSIPLDVAHLEAAWSLYQRSAQFPHLLEAIEWRFTEIERRDLREPDPPVLLPTAYPFSVLIRQALAPSIPRRSRNTRPSWKDINTLLASDPTLLPQLRHTLGPAAEHIACWASYALTKRVYVLTRRALEETNATSWPGSARMHLFALPLGFAVFILPDRPRPSYYAMRFNRDEDDPASTVLQLYQLFFEASASTSPPAPSARWGCISHLFLDAATLDASVDASASSASQSCFQDIHAARLAQTPGACGTMTGPAYRALLQRTRARVLLNCLLNVYEDRHRTLSWVIPPMPEPFRPCPHESPRFAARTLEQPSVIRMDALPCPARFQ